MNLIAQANVNHVQNLINAKKALNVYPMQQQVTLMPKTLDAGCDSNKNRISK